MVGVPTIPSLDGAVHKELSKEGELVSQPWLLQTISATHIIHVVDHGIMSCRVCIGMVVVGLQKFIAQPIKQAVSRKWSDYENLEHIGIAL